MVHKDLTWFNAGRCVAEQQWVSIISSADARRWAERALRDRKSSFLRKKVQAMTTVPMQEWTKLKADVAIIGGGIAGLTAGISLLQNGLKLAVVEDGSARKAASRINAGTVALQNKVPRIQDICLAAIKVRAELHHKLNSATHYKRPLGLLLPTSTSWKPIMLLSQREHGTPRSRECSGGRFELT